MRNVFLAIIISIFSTAQYFSQQKTIKISEELIEHAKMHKVKIGAQWMGKISKLNFDEFEIVKGKNKGPITEHRSNLFDTKSQGKTKGSFNFELTNKNKDTAYVSAVNEMTYNEIHSLQILDNVFVGSDEVLANSNYFIAEIDTSINPDDFWVLIINSTQGTEVEFKNEAFLTNDERIIELRPTPLYDDITRLMSTINGYEFFENGNPIAAVQFYGPGMWGMNKKLVWLKKDLEPNFKLILASSMVALLQQNLNDFSSLNHTD